MKTADRIISDVVCNGACMMNGNGVCVMCGAEENSNDELYECAMCNDEGVVIEGSYDDEREVPCPECHPVEERYDTVEEANGER